MYKIEFEEREKSERVRWAEKQKKSAEIERAWTRGRAKLREKKRSSGRVKKILEERREEN